jgi:hypothetical protein
MQSATGKRLDPQFLIAYLRGTAAGANPRFSQPSTSH